MIKESCNLIRWGLIILSRVAWWVKVLQLESDVLDQAHTVHPPPLSAGEGEGLNFLQKFLKGGGGLTGPQLLGLESEIFNDKKIL